MDRTMDAETKRLIDKITGQGKNKANELVQILTDQQKQKKDYIAPTSSMTMRVQTDNIQSDQSTGELQLQFEEIMKDGGPISSQFHSMPLTEWGHRQIAEKTGIPLKYYDRMLQEKQNELLAKNVNAWIDDKEQRFIRTMNGQVRAILSDRYLVLDHMKAIQCAATRAAELGAVMADCHLTETMLYVKMVVPHETWEIKAGHHHIRGIVFSNSEVGAGSFSAEPFVMKLLCTNGMIGMDKLARVHLGSKMELGMFISNKTQELEADLVASKLQDIVEGVFDREKFDSWMELYRETTEVKLRSPADATKNVIQNFKLNENMETDLLNALIGEGDPTQYGLINALTAHAQKVSNNLVRIELEKVAGEISAMPVKTFDKLINVEAPLVTV